MTVTQAEVDRAARAFCRAVDDLGSLSMWDSRVCRGENTNYQECETEREIYV